MIETRDYPCQVAVERMTEYLEGALPDEERSRFEKHLALCESCVAYLEQLELTVRLLSGMTGRDLDPGIRQELIERFRQWRGSFPDEEPS